MREALRRRKVRAVVGFGALLLIPALVPFLGLTTTYGKAQLSRADALVDLVCAPSLACDAAAEITRDTRRDDRWVVGYVVLGSIAAVCLTGLRRRGRILGALSVVLLLLGGGADLVENAKLRDSMSALAGAADRNVAIATLGDSAQMTVLFGWFKTGFLAVALVIVIGSLFRPTE